MGGFGVARPHFLPANLTYNNGKQIEEMISVSDFPLSGATAINRILGAIESNWGIV